MIKCFYDLHIHTGLSPCASDDMSPNNIINMALLKGLDMIAITDHNSGKNVKVCLTVAEGTPLVVVPGIEVESREGIHLLCYFRTIADLESFNKIIEANLPCVENNEQLWGRQLIYDENDEVIGSEQKLLVNSTMIGINDLVSLVHCYRGLVFASHVNRFANSLITILGFIPEDLPLHGVEFTAHAKTVNIDKKLTVIKNSDAHSLGDISEKTNYLLLKEKSLAGFFACFGD